MDFSEHSRLMFDLLAVAFQADLTRVGTFMLAREGSTRAYREIGISDAHHPLTHHRGNPEICFPNTLPQIAFGIVIP